MRKYSVVIPVYNRPDEIDELLESLTHQQYPQFEVIVVEDGSTNRCDEIVKKYSNRLSVQYFYKENTGQGFSRNYGFERATGDYFIVFDSDTLIPPDYFATLENHLNTSPLDAFGGPDAARDDFSDFQKAVSYSMTSIFTTGGIRGQKSSAGKFQPRSYNMGISREVWEKTGGFAKRDMGEDIEFSTRILNAGFRVGLIEKAFVYHKRRGSFGEFWKQVVSFGRTRIVLNSYNPNTLKLVHTLPAVFTLGCVSIPIFWFFFKPLAVLGLCLLLLFTLVVFIDATLKNKSLSVGVLSVLATFTQLIGYGVGFFKELIC